MKRSLLSIWILMIATIFYLNGFNFLDASNPEARTLLFFQMAILTLPLGYCAAMLAGVLFYIMSVFFEIDAGNFEIYLTLSLMIAAGYVQWFILLPKLFVWIKNKSKRENS